MTATSTRHARALAEAVMENLEPERVPEGMALGEWVLVDFGEVVVHIFNGPQRLYYNFDRLWRHAPSFEIENFPTQAPKVSNRSRQNV